MATLPTNRTTSDTAADHVTDHNTLHTLNNQLGTFTQSTTAPGSPATGDLWLDTDATSVVEHSHSGAYELATGAWTVYTPTIGDMTLGNGSVSGRWVRHGRKITVYGKILFGTTTAMVNYLGITFPVGANAGPLGANGTVIFHDSSAGLKVMGSIYAASNGDDTAYVVTYAGLDLSSTVPFTWANGDSIRWNVTYEANA